MELVSDVHTNGHKGVELAYKRVMFGRQSDSVTFFHRTFVTSLLTEGGKQGADVAGARIGSSSFHFGSESSCPPAVAQPCMPSLRCWPANTSVTSRFFNRPRTAGHPPMVERILRHLKSEKCGVNDAFELRGPSRQAIYAFNSCMQLPEVCWLSACLIFGKICNFATCVPRYNAL